MLKRLVMCIFLLSAALPAAAVNYTDLWYIPAESGWGANIVQSDNFLFLTFFIYGIDGKPTWYSAQLTKDATGFYNGKLYATTGTYYGATWTPGNTPATEVGTASFQPTSPYTARLLYIVNTPAPLAANVTKLIQRQTLTPITIGGSYVGAQSGAYSGCNSASGNGGYSDFFSLQVTQSTDRTVTLAFAYQGLSCTFTGTLTQFGQLYTVPTTAYKCSTGLDTNASLDELRATSLGFEGRFSAAAVGGGCREDATFSAVLH